ncbi:MAG: hypothetical protein JNM83_05235 [Myxococcales bacterium]|nr:hypothetical protein [Myxococcales bacterium]
MRVLSLGLLVWLLFATSADAKPVAASAATLVECDKLLPTVDLPKGLKIETRQADKLVGRSCLARWSIEGRGDLALSIFLDEGPEKHFLRQTVTNATPIPGVKDGLLFETTSMGNVFWVAQGTIGRASITVFTSVSSPVCESRADLVKFLKSAIGRFPSPSAQAHLGETPSSKPVALKSTGPERNYAPVPKCPQLISAAHINSMCHVATAQPLDRELPDGGCVFSELPGDQSLHINVLADRSHDIAAAKESFSQPLIEPLTLENTRMVPKLGNQAMLATIGAPDADLAGDRVLIVRAGNIAFMITHRIRRSEKKPACSDGALIAIAKHFVSRLTVAP